MNCCMQDAWNLGWKLAYVLDGTAPESLLESYERERKPIGQQVIDAASAIHELFMAGRNSGPEGLVALRDSGFLTELVGKVSGLSYHYRPEGAGAPTLPGAGDRMPNVRLPPGSGREWSTDLLRHTRLTLLAALPSGTDRSLEDWATAIATTYRGRVEAHVVRDAPDDLVGSERRAHCYLVRPDGYVAVGAPADKRREIDRWLRESLR
jgi:NADPH-dependent dioxygenase